MPTIAVLKNNFLEGIKVVETTSEEDIIVDPAIDLPMDGTYKWDSESKSFIPKGHGFGRPEICPVSSPLVMYRLSKQIPGTPHPDVLLWQQWYEKNLLQAHKESIQRPKKAR